MCFPSPRVDNISLDAFAEAEPEAVPGVPGGNEEGVTAPGGTSSRPVASRIALRRKSDTLTSAEGVTKPVDMGEPP